MKTAYKTVPPGTVIKNMYLKNKPAYTAAKEAKIPYHVFAQILSGEIQIDTALDRKLCNWVDTTVGTFLKIQAWYNHENNKRLL